MGDQRYDEAEIQAMTWGEHPDWETVDRTEADAARIGAQRAWREVADALKCDSRQDGGAVPTGARMNRPEPRPQPSDAPAAWDLVLADMKDRDRKGTEKYGQRLTPGDGRSSLVDAYQELLDLVVYLRKAIYEAEGR